MLSVGRFFVVGRPVSIRVESLALVNDTSSLLGSLLGGMVTRRVPNGFDTPAELVARCRSAKAILLMKRDPQRAVVWLVMVLFPLMSAFIASAVVVIVT